MWMSEMKNLYNQPQIFLVFNFVLFLLSPSMSYCYILLKGSEEDV